MTHPDREVARLSPVGASAMIKTPLAARVSPRRYRLVGADGTPYWSDLPGVLGGNGAARIYGRLDCRSALRALERADRYRRHRVFFASQEDAISAGYRPCGHCLPQRYKAWKSAQESNSI